MLNHEVYFFSRPNKLPEIKINDHFILRFKEIKFTISIDFNMNTSLEEKG